jgi:glucosamine-6-phosphate deaminase
MDMKIRIYPTKDEMARAAAFSAAEGLQKALDTRGAANLILATGASQFEMLACLVGLPVDWPKVTVFHLDEYIGLPETHPASFRKYLTERFAAKVPGLAAFHYVNGDAADSSAECRRLGALIRQHPIDVACIGIGENGHLAFNDPPADFETEEPYLVVNLDEACRRQQLGEGWFPTLADVPRQAISMSIRQILKSRQIVCTVPDRRKAEAVKNTVRGPVTNLTPASILQTHTACDLVLDEAAASAIAAGDH